MYNLAKLLILFGALLILLGGLVLLIGKVAWLGRLPGDIYIQKKNFLFYFPVVSCIFVSLLLSLLLWLWSRH